MPQAARPTRAGEGTRLALPARFCSAADRRRPRQRALARRRKRRAAPGQPAFRRPPQRSARVRPAAPTTLRRAQLKPWRHVDSAPLPPLFPAAAAAASAPGGGAAGPSKKPGPGGEASADPALVPKYVGVVWANPPVRGERARSELCLLRRVPLRAARMASRRDGRG